MGLSIKTTLNKNWGMAAFLTIIAPISGQPVTEDSPSLGEAFNAGAPEVEPIVVGRDRWNEKPLEANQENLSSLPEESSKNEESKSTRIDELDPLETQQVKPDSSTLPITPPKVPPATQIIRNFEGTLVFKPRNLGFANDFP